MTVYVDDMRAKFGRLIMCHMIADSGDELHAMAHQIGIARRWFQGDHYDICLTKRAAAVQLGAVEITQRQLGCMAIRRRATGSLGSPDEAVVWRKNKIISFPRRHGLTALKHLIKGSES